VKVYSATATEIQSRRPF